MIYDIIFYTHYDGITRLARVPRKKKNLTDKPEHDKSKTQQEGEDNEQGRDPGTN